MKKAYEKPQIVFDSFELSQSIAAGCEFKSNYAHGECAVDIHLGGDMFLFLEAMETCGTNPGPGFYDDVCYDVPHEDNNVFSS